MVINRTVSFSGNLLKFNLMASFPEILMMSMPGGGEWMWLLLAIVLLFGAKKLPELARGLGKGIREFKDAKDGAPEEPGKEGPGGTV
jgi:sec-independent protein translocase protein TatA